MKKEENKLTPGEKAKAEERMRETIRKSFDFGNGAEVLIASHKSASDEQGTVSHFFTSRIPKLQIKSRNVQKTINVEMSSVEEDNQSLLHFLFKKSKK
ncbi:MAG: hypothetical protein PHY34_03555 [Patescibacteria group bacterium]|nr:hypothetical protein [Patescibacteria group bacterium]MDD5715641.1 hypothetical protein [Patescibacteria group bacterium]